jgi:hypothetical protein
MKIIAKKGTAFEQTIKSMCEKMTEGVTGAQDLVAKAAGVKPINVFHLFRWGTISKLVPEFDIHPDDLEKVNPRFLRKKKGCKYVYVPALRYKEGKELDAAFREFAKEHEVTEEPLNEYGIHMVDWKKGISYSIQLAHDTQKDLYMLVCSNSIPEAFDKQKIAKDQFEIEY